MSEPGPPLVQLRNVGKAYPLRSSAAGQLAHMWSCLRGISSSQHGFHALSGIDLEIRKGQSTGLVGVNGAGKSTLMKIIAGVVRPTLGDVCVNARIGALLELGAGFHPEYTGRENIALSCTLLGLSPAEADARAARIIEFADIGTQIDQPIKHYSSGMVVRLGFAVVTAIDPELLITDEVLAVGDESFQRKCMAWLDSYLSAGGTLLLCSHSMYHIQKLCRQALWIHEGKIRRAGTADDVAREYLAWHEERNASPSRVKRGVAGQGDPNQYHVRQMSLNSLHPVEPLVMGEASKLVISGELHSPDGRAPGVAVGLLRADGTPVLGLFSEVDGYRPWKVDQHTYGFAIEYPSLPLLPGRYTARCHAMDPEGMRLYECLEASFDIHGRTRAEGFCQIPHRWLGAGEGQAPECHADTAD